jgi:hypothetical protein
MTVINACMVQGCPNDARRAEEFCALHLDPRTRVQCEAYGCFLWASKVWKSSRCSLHRKVTGLRTKKQMATETRQGHDKFKVVRIEEAAHGCSYLGTMTSFGLPRLSTRARG